MHVHITDESCPKRQDALLVLVFYRTLEQMPRVLVRGLNGGSEFIDLCCSMLAM